MIRRQRSNGLSIRAFCQQAGVSESSFDTWQRKCRDQVVELGKLFIARLAYPTSKLKRVDYLYRYRGKTVSVQSIYRFLDRLNEQHSRQAQEVAYRHSRKILRQIQVVFYDMTSSSQVTGRGWTGISGFVFDMAKESL